MSAHAKFSPSGASRWLACPGSWWVNQQGQPAESGEAAKEGTRAHAVAEHCLLAGARPLDCVGQILAVRVDGQNEKFEIPEDMARHLEAYTSAVELAKEFGTGAAIEERVTVPIPAERELWGTADAIVYGDTLSVFDLKYGMYPVDPVENPQCAAYLLGALVTPRAKENPPERAEITIVQPRVSKEPKTWQIDDIDAFCDKWTTIFRDGIHRCADAARVLSGATDWSDHADRFEAGTHCRYCDFQIHCPAFTQLAIDQANADLETINDGGFKQYQIEDLAHRLELKAAVTNYYNKLEEHLTTLADGGSPVPGFKLVEKLGNRKWTLPDEEMMKKLRNQGLKKKDFVVEKVRTPAQIEKLIDNVRFLEKHIERPHRGRTIAPLTDRRPAVEPSITQDFDEI